MMMPDREKVIKAWEIFRDSNPYEICDGREFRAIKEPEYCMGQMIEDTIVLLKEQEEQIKTMHIAQNVIADYLIQPEIVRCKDCKWLLEYESREWQCEIKQGWFPVKPDWFCADGERKEGR